MKYTNKVQNKVRKSIIKGMKYKSQVYESSIKVNYTKHVLNTEYKKTKYNK